MNIKHLIITVAILLVVTAVFGAASYALNLYTGPIIEANSAGAANARLDAVMPEGVKGYEDVTSTLTIPEKLVSPTKWYCFSHPTVSFIFIRSINSRPSLLSCS